MKASSHRRITEAILLLQIGLFAVAGILKTAKMLNWSWLQISAIVWFPWLLLAVAIALLALLAIAVICLRYFFCRIKLIKKGNDNDKDEGYGSDNKEFGI